MEGEEGKDGAGGGSRGEAQEGRNKDDAGTPERTDKKEAVHEGTPGKVRMYRSFSAYNLLEPVVPT